MIKKYNLFTESVLNKLTGPTEEEIKEYIKQNPGKGLIEAASSNNLELIKMILDDKTKFIRYSDKRSAMWYACYNHFYSAVELLKSYGIDIDLSTAAERGYIDILQLGLDKKQDFLETDVLKKAVNGGKIESVIFIFNNYEIHTIDGLIVIEHIIKLTDEIPKNRYIDDRSPYIPNRIEIFKFIINNFDYSLKQLEDLWKFAQDKNSYTIRNYIGEIIKKKIKQ